MLPTGPSSSADGAGGAATLGAGDAAMRQLLQSVLRPQANGLPPSRSTIELLQYLEGAAQRTMQGQGQGEGGEGGPVMPAVPSSNSFASLMSLLKSSNSLQHLAEQAEAGGAPAPVRVPLRDASRQSRDAPRSAPRQARASNLTLPLLSPTAPVFCAHATPPQDAY